MATATGPLPGAAGGGRISLSEGTLEVFLRVLAANAGLLPSDTLQLFKMVQAAAVQAHPQLAAVAGDSSTLEAFAPDIGGSAGLPEPNHQGMVGQGLTMQLLGRTLRAAGLPRQATMVRMKSWADDPASGVVPQPTTRVGRAAGAAGLPWWCRLATVLQPASSAACCACVLLSAAEEEANAYFQRVYAGEITVEALVEVCPKP